MLYRLALDGAELTQDLSGGHDRVQNDDRRDDQNNVLHQIRIVISTELTRGSFQAELP